MSNDQAQQSTTPAATEINNATESTAVDITANTEIATASIPKTDIAEATASSSDAAASATDDPPTSISDAILKHPVTSRERETLEEPTNDSTDDLVVQMFDPNAKTAAEVKEEALAARAKKRAERKEKNHTLAEERGKAGEALVEKEDWQGASVAFLEAIRLWPSSAVFYSRLAGVYVKLESYEEAAHAATRALTLNPKLVDARYQRGVARMEQRLLLAAKVDFATILEHHPNHAAASFSLAGVTSFLESATHLGGHALGANPVDEEVKDLDFGFPHWPKDGEDEVDGVDNKLQWDQGSLSDSSDCEHTGNGVPCRFYNHDGCKRGKECEFMHAPDEKSVRDDLGKNVCLYLLLSSCKFGTSKCVYSHDKSCLPKRGWWTSEKEVEKVKKVLEMAEKSKRDMRAAEEAARKARGKARQAGRERAKTRDAEKRVKNGENPKAKDGETSKDGKKKAGETAAKDASLKDASTTARSRSGRRRNPSRKAAPIPPKPATYTYDSSNSDLDEQRMMNSGFTDYDLNELAAQGVKPRDDDAHAVLAALNY
ncbi:hypothetical protein BDQ12DRAFT_636513 [Crucibulum laeve]|uniref:C3H1-type domain-containing protein n=1 Tax=Crucibulum laeve TaxID=68775 RepID=A0A5C3LPX7_9AGAR|nr:hypothetical protein BDQ12DRAFT_636513 [Crucibulum laeve]